MLGAGSNDGSMSARAREQQKIEFAEQTAQIRRQLRQMEACTIEPFGKKLRVWDQMTICALLWVAFVTPFEVGLLPISREGGLLVLFVLNKIVDAIFIFDIFIQFFVPYRDRDGLWVMDNTMMAKRYLFSTRPARSFSLDFISSLPFDSIITAVNGEDEGGEYRSLKMLRIIKLVRVMRASRIFKRWEAQLGISHSSLKMMEFLLISLVMAHWLACLWCFVGRLGNYWVALESDEGEGKEWEATFPGVPFTYPGPRGPAYAYRHYSWIQKAGMSDASPWELYGPALYLALSNMFGGSGEPSPANYVEFYIQGLMMLVGSSLWAYIIGAGCGIIATLDPQGVEFRRTMDELNYFARDKDLPQHLTVKLRTFFQNTQHVIFARSYDNLLMKMSPLLRGEAALRVAEQSICRLPYFALEQVESGFLATAALKLQVGTYSLREYLPIENLTIIERGIAAREGRLRVKGSCLGHDMILELPHLRDWTAALALTVVLQVMTLSRDDLREVLLDSPKATELVRKAAFKLAFQRLIQRVADEYRYEKAAQEAAAGSPSKKVDFLRLAIPTAVRRAHRRAQSEVRSINKFGSPAFAEPMQEAHDGRSMRRRGFEANLESSDETVQWGSSMNDARDGKQKIVGIALLNMDDDEVEENPRPKVVSIEDRVTRVEEKLDKIVNMLTAMSTKDARRRRNPLPFSRGAGSTPGSAASGCDGSPSCMSHERDGDMDGVDEGEWQLKSRGPKLVMQRSESGRVVPSSSAPYSPAVRTEPPPPPANMAVEPNVGAPAAESGTLPSTPAPSVLAA